MTMVRWVGTDAPLLPMGVRPGHRQIDRGQGGQPLRGLQVGVRLVFVVGALGLAQQRGDPGQVLLCHVRPPQSGGVIWSVDVLCS